MHYQAQTLVDVAYEALKKDITQRVLVPGQRIILRELSERYGISETPIKQGLNRLITEGLVESIPRKGMKVRKIKLDEIEELMDIRFMIETYYIKKIMLTFHSSTEVRSRFSSNLTEHKQLIEHVADVNDHFRNYYLDQEFHQLFVKCSGNNRIVGIYNNLGTHAYSYYVYGRQDKEGMVEGVKEHEQIHKALIEQDEAELYKRVEIHTENARNNIYRMLKNNDT